MVNDSKRLLLDKVSNALRRIHPTCLVGVKGMRNVFGDCFCRTVRSVVCLDLDLVHFFFALGRKNSIFVVKYIFPKYLPEFINNRLSSRSSECTAARFKYPANRPGGGGRYSLPLRAVSSPRHSPLHTAHRLRGGR